MKDAVITVRLPRDTRQRIENLARQEGRSLSQQVERLIVQALGASATGLTRRRAAGSRSLAGALSGGAVPSLADFSDVRATLSASLGRRSRA